MANRELILYTRRGCHLCDEMKQQVSPLAREFGVTLREADIDADPALRAQFDTEVPVLFLDGKKVAKYRVDLDQLRRQLQGAN